LNGKSRFFQYNYSNMNSNKLIVSQPTLSRHISELEKTIGHRLFSRSASGLHLSPEGKRLIKHAETMNDAAHNLVLQAGSKSESLSGTVRLTASQIVAKKPILQFACTALFKRM